MLARREGSFDWETDGRVVFSIDTDEFSAEFPKDNGYTLDGVLWSKPSGSGLVHLEEADEDVEIIGIGDLPG
jgi:hypothetical protein